MFKRKWHLQPIGTYIVDVDIKKKRTFELNKNKKIFIFFKESLSYINIS